MLPCYSRARKAGLWAGRGCQVLMPTLLVGGSLIQQSWGHPGFLFFLRPCGPPLTILCPDPGLLGLKVMSLFCPQNLPFYGESSGWGFPQTQLSSPNIDCLHTGKLEISFLLISPRFLAGWITGQEVWVSRDGTGEGCWLSSWLGQQREEAAGYVGCKPH